MSDKELLDKEDGLEEAKASMGVDAEVPEPTTTENTPPGDKPEDEDKNKNPEQGDSVKPSKVSAIQNISQAVKGISQAKLEAAMPKIMAALNEEEGEDEDEEDKETVKAKDLPKVSKDDVDVSEDITAMFKGQDLSEEFTSKATTIFEAAVVSKVNEVLESVTVDLEAEVEAGKESMMSEMAEKLDSYLEYVAEEWMKENELAVEQGIRAEIQENFMKGLRDLFVENYIEVPEDKVDLVDELAEKVEELQSDINEEIEKNMDLKKELDEAKVTIILGKVSEGLTESQAIKLASLAEGVDFDSEESFTAKLETIKENYFVEEKTLVEDTNFDNEPLEIEEDAEPQIDPGMANYMNAISKSIKK
jgi:hypothetical protein